MFADREHDNDDDNVIITLPKSNRCGLCVSKDDKIEMLKSYIQQMKSTNDLVVKQLFISWCLFFLNGKPLKHIVENAIKHFELVYDALTGACVIKQQTKLDLWFATFTANPQSGNSVKWHESKYQVLCIYVLVWVFHHDDNGHILERIRMTELTELASRLPLLQANQLINKSSIKNLIYCTTGIGRIFVEVKEKCKLKYDQNRKRNRQANERDIETIPKEPIIDEPVVSPEPTKRKKKKNKNNRNK